MPIGNWTRFYTLPMRSLYRYPHSRHRSLITRSGKTPEAMNRPALPLGPGR